MWTCLKGIRPNQSVNPLPCPVSLQTIHSLDTILWPAENTILAYSRDLGRLFSFLKKRGHGPVFANRDDIRAFLVYLHKRGLSGNGVARRFATVRSFYRFMRYS